MNEMPENRESETPGAQEMYQQTAEALLRLIAMTAFMWSRT